MTRLSNQTHGTAAAQTAFMLRPGACRAWSSDGSPHCRCGSITSAGVVSVRSARWPRESFPAATASARYTPHDPLWVPIMFRCARVVVCPTGPRSTAPVCEVVECAELSGLVGGHWGLPQWEAPVCPSGYPACSTAAASVSERSGRRERVGAASCRSRRPADPLPAIRGTGRGSRALRARGSRA